MNKSSTLKYIAAAFLALSSLPAVAWDQAEMNKTIDQTNFIVNRGCSGTLLNSAGYILTASHCVNDQYETVTRQKIGSDGVVKEEKVRVAIPGSVAQKMFKGPNEVQENRYIYKIKAIDTKLDLALLKTDARLPNTKFAEMACNELTRGDTVYAVGNSYAVLYSSVSTGIVASLQRNYRDLGIAGDLGDLTDDGEHGLVQHTAVIAGGNSGGALYNNEGKVVGVNVRGAASGFSFSVPLSDVKQFLSSNGLEHLYAKCGG